MRDASLDEFLSTDEGEAEEPGDEADEDEDGVDGFGPEQSGSDSEPESDAGAKPEPEHDPDTESEPEGPPPVDGVEPARSTFAWSPDGAACAECGERVEDRWESDSGLVCVECKGW